MLYNGIILKIIPYRLWGVILEKVGVYCRLSDEDRYKKNKNDDSESIVNQKSMLLKYALEKGWDVVDIYSDDDYSGAGVFRPDFDRLIKDCESGKINLVLCKTQSRFSRDMEVIERYLHNKFIEWGVRFVSIVDNADTENEANKKSRQINGLVNEWYLEDLSNNIKKSLKNKREDGMYMGSFAPYGYLKDPNDKHKLIVDNNVSYVVKDIFDMYYKGMGYSTIAKNLNSRNILIPTLYKKTLGSNFRSLAYERYGTNLWNTDTIANILKNPVYIGNLVQGKRTSISYKNHKSKKVPETDWCICYNTHEPIIDKDIFDYVQTRLGKNEVPLKTGKVHMLSQKVYCKECGRVFMRNSFKSKTIGGEITKKAYLQCKGAKKYNICCNHASIRCEVLEEYILDKINKLITKCNKDFLKKGYEEELIKKNSSESKINNLNKELSDNEKKIAKGRLYFKSLYEDKINGLITDDDFRNLRSEYSNDIELLESRIEKIKSEILSLEKNQNKNVEIDSIIKKYKHIKELNKYIIDEFITKINIGVLDKKTNTRDIEVIWNFEL